MHDGVESTYAVLVVPDKRELDRLIKGKAAKLVYSE